MVFDIMRAKPKGQLLELCKELDFGIISRMKPFGNAMQKSLENTRIDSITGDMFLDRRRFYCSPPLTTKRESVLERYFDKMVIAIIPFI